MIQNLDYWYDKQMLRFLEQVVRSFSGFQYMPGIKNGVQQSLRTVPCKVANSNSLVAYIERNMSENTALTVPMITVYQTGLSGRREDVQNPHFISKVQVAERSVNNTVSPGQYESTLGNRYTVERIMPKPFEMTVQIDIWTSNLDQKYQLMEQIMAIMYPAFDIQNSTNALDWTALTTLYIDDISWSSRSIPIGTTTEIEISTTTLKLPIWLSVPAKVKPQKIIQQIITNIYDGDTVDVYGNTVVEGQQLTQIITTPKDAHIKVDGDIITLLNSHSGEYDENGNLMNWKDYLIPYGTLNPTISKIHLLTTNDINGSYVAGSLQFDTNNVNQLIWQIDPTTLPANTLDSVNAVINPINTYPGNNLPEPIEGTRYLIIQDIGTSQAWPNITRAYENDIIQYNNGQWKVVFNSKENNDTQYVLNNYSSTQLKWTGKEWVLSIGGIYIQGYWRLAL